MPLQPAPCDLLLRAANIVTQDEKRQVISDGAVAVAGSDIVAVGGFDDLAARFIPASILDLGRSILLPGLVNAHTHAAMTLYRGLADDIPLMEWLERHIWPLEQHLSEELVELGTLAGCAEMLRTGTTCFCDMYLREKAVFRAVVKAGIRAVLGEGFFAFPSPHFKSPEDYWNTVRDLQAMASSNPRIRINVAPHAVYTTTPETLAASRELARSLGCIWQIHCAETRSETEKCLSLFGRRPVQYLDELGLLGPGTLLVHCVDLDSEDMARIARSGSGVAHCPSSNLKLGSGFAPVPALLSQGVPVGLGTDGAASNNALNMYAEMRLAALLQKGLHHDPGLLPAQTVMDMATRNGARCLGLDTVGSIAPGMQADLTALDLNAPNLMPAFRPVSHAVYAATGHETRMTMVAGRIAYLDGRYPDIDMEGLGRELEKAAAWALSHSG